MLSDPVGPFREFRSWARNAPPAERLVAMVGLAVACALIVWLLVPAHRPGSTGAIAAGQSGVSSDTVPTGGATTPATAISGPSTAAPGVAIAPARTTAPGSSTAAASPSRTASAGAACVSPPGSAKGITATEINVAVGLIQIAGPAANSLVGIPPPDEQQGNFDAVIDSINKGGGVACRKLVPKYYLVNPVDQSSEQQQCLDIAASDVFALIDEGGMGATAPAPITCLAQHKVPYLGAYFMSAALAKQFYPYLFDFNTFEGLYRDTALALRDRGFFDRAAGFKKLGFVYRSCYPDAIELFRGWLRQAGVSDADMVTYDVGCPAAFAAPSDISQAILKFKSSGVTHVTTANFVGDMPNFTKLAQQQGFNPKYGLPDEALISTSYGSSPPDPDNINNAITISQARNGEERTPGVQKTAGTLRCDAIYRAHGMAGVYERASVAGNTCDQLWMFQAALEHAPSLQREALAVGLQRARSVEFAYPQAPNDFSGAGVTTGGEFWRVAQFHVECRCWQLADATFHPSYR